MGVGRALAMMVLGGGAGGAKASTAGTGAACCTFICSGVFSPLAAAGDGGQDAANGGAGVARGPRRHTMRNFAAAPLSNGDNARRGAMGTFRFTCEMQVTVYTEVEADTMGEALRQAHWRVVHVNPDDCHDAVAEDWVINSALGNFASGIRLAGEGEQIRPRRLRAT